MAAKKTKTQRARLKRPSPTAHAAAHKGEVKKGHDGRLWLSEPDKNGVFKRGSDTGREKPLERDHEWLAEWTDGKHQTDPQDAVDFAAGMAAGAKFHKD